MRERVLITGGAGFIASHLAASHLASGDEVHLLVRPGGPAHPDRIQPDAIVHEVDLADLHQMRQCLGYANPTLLYHLASATGRDTTPLDPAQCPAATRDLDQLMVLLAAAAESPALRAMVRSGSLAEYGNQPSPPPETRREQPRNVYTAAMVAGTHYCAIAQPRLKFGVLTARLALTYGPHQSEQFLLPALLRHCFSDATFTINRPDDRRDMVFIDDIVAGLRAMATSDLPGGTILNLASGRVRTVREVVEIVLEVMGTPADRIRFEPTNAPTAGVDALHGSADRAALLLGWRARTPLAEGIARTARSFAEAVA